MAFLDFLTDPRRRRLAEAGLADAPDSPYAPAPTRRPPILPSGVAPIGWELGHVAPDTARNRAIPEAPTVMPGAPRPSPLPDTERPLPPLARTPPFVPRSAPGNRMPAPPGMESGMEPPTRTQRMEAEREAYLRGTPGRGKSALLGLLRGAAQGLATGQGLAGALGGAIAGAGFGGLNPRGQREMEFEQQMKPKILERWRNEEADRAERERREDRARAIEMDELKRRQAEAQINAAEAEARARKFETVAPGYGVIDIETGKPIYTAPPTPPSARPQGLINTARGIFDPTTRTYVEGTEWEEEPPASAFEALKEIDDLHAEAAEAWRKWSQPELAPGETDTPEKKSERERLASEAQKRRNDAIRRFGKVYGKWFDTGGFVEPSGNQGWAHVTRRPRPQGVLRDRAPQTKQAPQQSGQQKKGGSITRARSQFNTSKFPGLRFD